MKTYKYEETEAAVSAIQNPSVFLAGPTVRGHQPHLTSWRFAAVEEFEKQGFKGDLIIPEFTSKTESDKNKAWVPMWEWNGLKKADCILCWLPRTRELIGLTTNWELGYWIGADPGKLIYGRPDDAYRCGYTDIMWDAIMQRPRFNTLEDTVKYSIVVAYSKFLEKNPSRELLQQPSTHL